MGALPRSLHRRTSVAAPVRSLLGSARVPAGDEAGIGRLGLLDPAPLLLAVALDVVGVGRAFLAARRLVACLQLEIAQLLGVE